MTCPAAVLCWAGADALDEDALDVVEGVDEADVVDGAAVISDDL